MKIEVKQQDVKRLEDVRLLTGKGRYTTDLLPEGTLSLVFLRTPHAHARIERLDVESARGAGGVLAVYTAADLASAGLREVAGGIALKRPDGGPAPKTDIPALAATIVRHVGEAVAAVVARSTAEALDALDLIEVDYETLPVATAENARQPDAPAVWDDAPDNIAFRWQGGNAAAVETAIAAAAHVTRLPMKIARLAVNSMEPRNVVVVPQPDGRLLVHASHQAPFSLRAALEAVGFAKDSVAVEVGDVGGSFGLKVGHMLEAVVAAHAARDLGRPVCWEGTRSEAFLVDDHAREMTSLTEIAFDAGHRITGMRVAVDYAVGSYVIGKSLGLVGNMGGFAGPYDVPAIHAQIDGVFSHTNTLAAYRGAGRPEATLFLERALDAAARELGLDAIELRRRNLIPAAKMPYKTAMTFTYDCGEFDRVMEEAAALADVAGFPARRAEAAARGRLRGLGISNSIEIAGGPFGVYAPDICRVALMSDGRLRVQTGSMSVGQGFETVFAQMVADRFGVGIGDVVYQQGSTEVLPFGRGNGGSSMTCVGGAAVAEAAEDLAGELTLRAATLLGVQPEAVSFADGMFRGPGNRSLTVAELARQSEADDEGVAARAEATFKPEAGTFPNGTHICEVEIDPETGEVAVVGYAAVEDIGTVVNPMTAHGQIQGGVVQGLGQVLGEEIVYSEDGQMLTGSYMDYRMPRAADFPAFKLAFHPVPTAVNPLGAKGVGEAGTVGALSAGLNAVNDALAGVGVRNFDMPASPGRVWTAIEKAKRGA